MTKRCINDKLIRYNDYSTQIEGVFMKKFLKILMLSLLMLVSVFAFVACGEDGGDEGKTGLLYKMYAGDSYYTVYGYVDDGSEADTLDISEYNKDGVTIGRIKANAFKDNNTLKTLIIPSSVETIDAGAFANMKKLETIQLPFVGATAVADTSFNSIDEAENKSVGAERTFGYVFGSDEYTGGLAMTQYYDENNTNVTYVPSTLTKVIINNPNTEVAYNIPMYAFSGANLINEVELKGNIEIIGEAAFKNALGLSKVNLPASVVKIEKQAFMGTTNLKTGFIIDEGSALTVLGESVFNGSAVKSVELPASVNVIGNSCFANSKISSVNLGSVAVIPTGAFANCDYLVEVAIPQTTTTIKAHAFLNCDALTTVVVSGSWNFEVNANNLVNEKVNEIFVKA